MKFELDFDINEQGVLNTTKEDYLQAVAIILAEEGEAQQIAKVINNSPNDRMRAITSSYAGVKMGETLKGKDGHVVLLQLITQEILLDEYNLSFTEILDKMENKPAGTCFSEIADTREEFFSMFFINSLLKTVFDEI